MNQEIDGFVDDALTENEHFTNYVMLLQRIDEFAKEMKSDKNTMYEYAFARLKSFRSPSRILTFAVHYDASDHGFAQFSDFCAEAQSLVYRLCYSYSMNA
jgi:hypothetical protein